MISVSDLWVRLDALGAPLPGERIPLASAHDRVLCETIRTPEDMPSFDRSAIDGYLVREDQRAGVVTLAGTVAPGCAAPSVPAHGTALRVLTGGALPPAGIGLIMQEDTEPAGNGAIRLLQPPSVRHIRRRASQARAGDTLLASGRRLNAGSLALLASLGATHPLVTRRARVAHLVTGAELVPPHVSPGAGQIRDSNSTLITELLRHADADLCWYRRVSDSRSDTRDALASALASDADVILISGGASVGDHDHTGALLASEGFTLHCDKVASRPGKPFIAASREGRLAFGLPGNPLSHFVCFHLFVKRVLSRLAGTVPVPLMLATLSPGSDQLLRPDPRETWWPCAWDDDGSRRRARPIAWRDSSDLTVLSSAEGLVRMPARSENLIEVEVLPCT
jgi:molybdopterin molybdotransferase